MFDSYFCCAYFSISKALRITLTTLTTIAPPKAGKNPVTTNPSSKEEVNPRIIAFIMNVNNPRVKIFNGRVNNIKIGFIDIFNIPNMMEAISKSESSLNKIPEKIRLAAPRDNEFITHRKTTFLSILASQN